METKTEEPKPAETTSAETKPAETKPEDKGNRISYDEFARVELRVARVLEAAPVENADRLLRLRVDIGSEERQVVAGIAQAYTPEELVGRQLIFVANLKPAKIRGVESNGMILAAGEKQVLALSALDREVPPGTKVR